MGNLIIYAYGKLVFGGVIVDYFTGTNKMIILSLEVYTGKNKNNDLTRVPDFCVNDEKKKIERYMDHEGGKVSRLKKLCLPLDSELIGRD